MTVYQSIVRFFQDGGIWMGPIAVVLAFTIAISLRKTSYTSFYRFQVQARTKELAFLIASSGMGIFRDQCQEVSTEEARRTGTRRTGTTSTSTIITGQKRTEGSAVSRHRRHRQSEDRPAGADGLHGPAPIFHTGCRDVARWRLCMGDAPQQSPATTLDAMQYTSTRHANDRKRRQSILGGQARAPRMVDAQTGAVKPHRSVVRRLLLLQTRRGIAAGPRGIRGHARA
jgi:hypothetical protein